MKNDTDEKAMYDKANEFLKENRYFDARKNFQILYDNNSEYRDLALSKLLLLDIKRTGDFYNVRKIINEHDIKIPEFQQIVGRFEMLEYNYNRSIECYSNCFDGETSQYSSLFGIGNVYLQLNEYDKAEKIFETIKLNNAFYVKAMFKLVTLCLLNYDYNYAYKLLQNINLNNLPNNIIKEYYKYEKYILYCMGKLKEADLNTNEIDDYIFNRLYNKDENILLKHIEEHKTQTNKFSFFLPEVDLNEILIDSYNKITKMNGVHFAISDMYKFKYTKPIGSVNGNISSDLAVVTIIGTKDILTIYPIRLSEEFDIEKNSTNKELIIKQGGNK